MMYRRKVVSIMLVLMLVSGMLTMPVFAAEDTTILTAQQKYDALAAKGIFSGVNAAGDAALDQNMNRAQFARVAALILGLEGIGLGQEDTKVVTDKPFSDVELGAWYVEEIAAVKEAGVFVGNPDGTFKPNADVSIQELATVVAKLLGLDLDEDAKVEGADSWAAKYIQAIQDAGIPFPTNYKGHASRSDLVGVAYTADGMINSPEKDAMMEEFDQTKLPVISINDFETSTVQSLIVLNGGTYKAVSLQINEENVALKPLGLWEVTVSLEPGTNIITFIATDEEGQISTKEIEVIYTAPMMLTPIPDQTSNAGEYITISLSTIKQTEEELTYTASGLPPNILVNNAMATIAGASYAEGTYDVTVTVSDALGNEDSQSFTWVIQKAPVVYSPRPPSSSIQVTVSTTEPVTVGDSVYVSSNRNGIIYAVNELSFDNVNFGTEGITKSNVTKANLEDMSFNSHIMTLTWCSPNGAGENIKMDLLNLPSGEYYIYAVDDRNNNVSQYKTLIIDY